MTSLFCPPTSQDLATPLVELWTHKFQSSGPTVYSLYCDQANKSILHAVSLLAGTRLFRGKSVDNKSRLTLCSE